MQDLNKDSLIGPINIYKTPHMELHLYDRWALTEISIIIQKCSKTI